MYKIRVISIGKTKEAWLNAALNEYLKRLQPWVAIDLVWVKTNLQLEQFAIKEKLFICLDSEGQLLNSQEFSGFLYQKLEKGDSRLTFVIGGAEGLSNDFKKERPLISLSPLTFTHQLTRLILVEQIYRAFEIFKGSKYHK
jgi:23S rRNA (pseudouridine1915-N3)-methyltransferase